MLLQEEPAEGVAASHIVATAESMKQGGDGRFDVISDDLGQPIVLVLRPDGTAWGSIHRESPVRWVLVDLARDDLIAHAETLDEVLQHVSEGGLHERLPPAG